MSVFGNETGSVFDERGRNELVIGRDGDRFAERGLVVGRINDVFLGGYDRARNFLNGERGGIDVVIVAFVSVFFAPFVDASDAFDVESHGDFVVSGGKNAEVRGQALHAADFDPIGLVEPIEEIERVLIRSRGLTALVDNIAVLIASDERYVEEEVVDNGGVADILDVEVDADVFSGDVVVHDVRDAVDDNLGRPVIDGVFENRQVRRDDRLEFERAHIDGAHDAFDGETDAARVSGKVGRSVAVERVTACVDRRRGRLQSVLGIELRIRADNGAIIRVERVLSGAGLSGVREQGGAQRSASAFRDKEVVSGSGRDVVGEDRVVDRRGAVRIEARAVRRLVVGDRNVDKRRIGDRVDRAAELFRDVLSEERVRRVDIAAGVNRAAAELRRIADEVAVRDRDFAVRVDRAAVRRRRLVRLHDDVVEFDGILGVDRAAVELSAVIDRRERARNFESSNLESAAFTDGRFVLIRFDVAVDNDVFRADAAVVLRNVLIENEISVELNVFFGVNGAAAKRAVALEGRRFRAFFTFDRGKP